MYTRKNSNKEYESSVKSNNDFLNLFHFSRKIIFYAFFINILSGSVQFMVFSGYLGPNRVKPPPPPGKNRN